eukprot:g4985.t1
MQGRRVSVKEGNKWVGKRQSALPHHTPKGYKPGELTAKFDRAYQKQLSQVQSLGEYYEGMLKKNPAGYKNAKKATATVQAKPKTEKTAYTATSAPAAGEKQIEVAVGRKRKSMAAQPNEKEATAMKANKQPGQAKVRKPIMVKRRLETAASQGYVPLFKQGQKGKETLWKEGQKGKETKVTTTAPTQRAKRSSMSKPANKRPKLAHEPSAARLEASSENNGKSAANGASQPSKLKNVKADKQTQISRLQRAREVLKPAVAPPAKKNESWHQTFAF